VRVDEAERPRLRAWEDALRGFDAGSARILKAEGSSRVFRAPMLGRDVVIKVRELRGIAERVKWAAGAARGFRHWRGATWLMDHGFGTARPLVLASDGSREWLVMEAIEGKTLLEHIAARDLTVREEHALAKEVGRHVSAMRKAGWFNRDFKPSNVMVRLDRRSIACIDCVAIRRGGDGAVRMLHALAVEPTGLGVLPRKALLARVVWSMVEADFEGNQEGVEAVRLARWATRRAFWRLVRESLRRHGDPTPRTNPLAR
jgi:tRNA A-37 threonylcarbamoyl transferase component Bud32